VSLPCVRRLLVAILLTVGVVGVVDAQPAPFDMRIEAPPVLAPLVERVANLDRTALVAALARAGLPVPPRVDLTLLSEDDPRARAIPRGVVGRATGGSVVEILPARIGPYPYGSLESVLWHEIAHVALSRQAGQRALPRWFHEGVATSVERDWGLSAGLRLRLAVATEPDLPAVERLFASAPGSETVRAYLLAAVLVSDLRQRHGAAIPGRIAGLVARGVPFRAAFEQYTGNTPGAAAARAWESYRRWTTWIPAVTSGSAVWFLTMTLACVAFVVRLRRRARRRRNWDESGPGG
jgi:hypothetical protein